MKKQVRNISLSLLIFIFIFIICIFQKDTYSWWGTTVIIRRYGWTKRVRLHLKKCFLLTDFNKSILLPRECGNFLPSLRVAFIKQKICLPKNENLPLRFSLINAKLLENGPSRMRSKFLMQKILFTSLPLPPLLNVLFNLCYRAIGSYYLTTRAAPPYGEDATS